MPRNMTKWNHVRCLIKNREGRNTRNRKCNKQKTVTKIVNFNLTISMITLNLSGLNVVNIYYQITF